MHRSVFVASLIAFIASFCTLVIELVAGRIMAPYVGVSLYTWTSIIGVVLAGISLGAYLGGLLADRFPRYSTLALLFLLSGLLTFTIQPVVDRVGVSSLLPGGDTTPTFILRIVLLTTYVFLLPAIVLGMISPLVVKLSVNNLKTSGNVVGKIYAYSTLGSILGTFVTGFFLIEALGVKQILATVGWILIFSAPLCAILLSGFRTVDDRISLLRVAAFWLFFGAVVLMVQAYVRWEYWTSQQFDPGLASIQKVLFQRDKLLALAGDVDQDGKNLLDKARSVHVTFLLALGGGLAALLTCGILWRMSIDNRKTVASASAPSWEEDSRTEPIDPFAAPKEENVQAKRAILLAGVATFVASFCILAIEVVAGRILAPYVGVSLYTWTSIIGVVLLGISLGAYVGGIVADRFPRPSTLGVIFFLSGMATLTIPFIIDKVADGDFVRIVADYYGLRSHYNITVPFLVRILLATMAVFLLPAFLLGMISPIVVKLSIDDLQKAGDTVGKIYAFSTLGAILGTFLTGFLLIEWLGTRTILYAVAAILMVMAPVFGGLFRDNVVSRRALLGICTVLLVAALVGCSLQRQVLATPRDLTKDKTTYNNGEWSEPFFYKESDYYTLKISNDGKKDRDSGKLIPIRTLMLDHLVHSYTHMGDPEYLKYDYLTIYKELVEWQRSRRPAHRYLFIGGGGYTLPRYFDKTDSKAEIDVVEIDPWVTKVANEHLGINDTRIRSFNQDGRWFAMNCKDKYDFVFGDAFNDLSIPYHLTTVEFNRHVKNLLTPDGMFMALVIDSVKDGEFLPSYLKTLQAAFGEDNVRLITIYEQDLDDIPHETCIIVASQQPLDFEEFKRYLKDYGEEYARAKGEQYHRVSNVVPLKRLKDYLGDVKRRGRPPMVLTDDYVPADNLIAKVFHERYSFEKRGAK